MATGAERQKMDEAAAELRRQMEPALEFVAEEEDSLFSSWTLNDQERSIIKNIKDEAQRAEEWLTTWRSWAERGKAPNGDNYPVAFYLRVGRDIANAFAAYMKAELQADAFVLGQAAVATVEDLGQGVQRAGEATLNVLDGIEDATEALAKPWPTWVKLLLGGGALGLTALLIHELAGKIPDLSGVADASAAGGGAA